jgi:hypothetical protein
MVIVNSGPWPPINPGFMKPTTGGAPRDFLFLKFVDPGLTLVT